MRTFLTILALLAASKAWAFEHCDINYRDYNSEIGKQAWLLRDDGFPNVYPASESRALQVQVLEQTGPEKWSEDYNASRPYGEEVTIIGGVGKASYGYDFAYFKVRAKDGTVFVTSKNDTKVIDFRKCRPSELLKERTSVDGTSFQFFENVPYRVKPGVKPLTTSGDWVSEEGIKDLEYVVCTEYGENYIMQRDVIECDAFYKTKPNGHDRPLGVVFVSDDDLEPIILK